MKYSNRLLQQEYAALMYVFFACHMSMKNFILFFGTVGMLKCKLKLVLYGY